jgi:hypothetical protein
MNKFYALAGIALCLLPAAAQAAPAKMKPAMKPAKMVTLYQADKCHMYFTPAQAKMDHYACPESKGKMHMVKMTPTAAKKAMMPAKKAM